MKILHLLYGLCGTGYLWHMNINKHHREELCMARLHIGPVLCYRLSHGVLTGLSGPYVEDLILCGNQTFRWISEQTRQKLEMKADEELPAEFTGFIVGNEDNVSFYIDQSHYLRKI